MEVKNLSQTSSNLIVSLEAKKFAREKKQDKKKKKLENKKRNQRIRNKLDDEQLR